MTSMAASYRVFRVGARPVAAIPDGPRRLRRAAARQCPGGTWRRRAVRAAAGLGVTLGLDRLFWPRVEQPLAERGLNLGAWLAQARGALGLPESYAVLLWPPQSWRGRVYLRLLDSGGRLRAFVKVALDPYNEGRLVNERRALACLRGAETGQVRFPRVLAEGRWAGQYSLAMEPFPKGGRPPGRGEASAGAGCATAWAGERRRLTEAELRGADWWRGWEREPAGCGGFRREVARAAAAGLETCRVHGDLAPGNILRIDGRYWVYDWEGFDERGPWLTDRLSYWLGERQRFALRRPDRAAAALARRFLGEERRSRADVAAGLAFLCAARSLAARAVADRWGGGDAEGGEARG